MRDHLIAPVPQHHDDSGHDSDGDGADKAEAEAEYPPGVHINRALSPLSPLLSSALLSSLPSLPAPSFPPAPFPLSPSLGFVSSPRQLLLLPPLLLLLRLSSPLGTSVVPSQSPLRPPLPVLYIERGGKPTVLLSRPEAEGPPPPFRPLHIARQRALRQKRCAHESTKWR